MKKAQNGQWLNNIGCHKPDGKGPVKHGPNFIKRVRQRFEGGHWTRPSPALECFTG
jgi:hypothetical protein